MCNFPHLLVILCVVATWMFELPQEIHMVGEKNNIEDDSLINWNQ